MTLAVASRIFTSQKVHARSGREQKASALKDQTSQRRATEPEHMIRNAHGDVLCLAWEIIWLSKLHTVPVHPDYRRAPYPALNVFYFPNGRYIDCLSLTYATNKGKMIKLHYKY